MAVMTCVMCSSNGKPSELRQQLPGFVAGHNNDSTGAGAGRQMANGRTDELQTPGDPGVGRGCRLTRRQALGERLPRQLV